MKKSYFITGAVYLAFGCLMFLRKAGWKGFCSGWQEPGSYRESR